MSLPKNLLKTEKIIKIAPSDTLSSALAKLSSSHDAAFVFSEEDKFLGVINPYYALIQSSHPGNAKVEHCVFHPPHISDQDDAERVAQLMIESKVHYLPVFDSVNTFLGVVPINRVLSYFANKPNFKVSISEIVNQKNKPLIKVNETDTVSLALNLYKQHKISKLVVVGKDEKLKGILSYYDLIYFLIAPKEKLQMGEKEGNKVSFLNQQVKNFAKNNVLTLQQRDSMSTALKMVLEKKIGSVVVVDEERYPIHIITKKDFIDLVITKTFEKPLQVVSKNLSEQNKKVVAPFFEYLSQVASQLPGVVRTKVVVKEEKQGGVFSIMLSFIPYKGAATVIKREGKNLGDVLKEIGAKITNHK